ncbi:N,N-dimethylformamidase beta subunit family domain-containing protein [Phyllobacterium endophyticum]|nr:N,N-dimethylformamidase beta subunit family domain-containing protein [Phyllobacterium endophyticum]MBB3236700.1 N,N-dimethylformamidase [Phyllobacterium endophyticum]TYR39681.1 hypothetical protein FY050_21680 [Phyllobacterium endophyticum]
MQIEAYLEEWSLLPGEIVRMAVSTEHPTVRVRLERVTRGPRDRNTVANHSFGTVVEGVDVTVAGRRQSTAMGSFAELPLRPGAAGRGYSAHLWFLSSVPDWDVNQTILAFATERDSRRIAVGVCGSKLYVSLDSTVEKLNLSIDAHVWYSLVINVEEIATKTRVTVDVSQADTLPSRALRNVEAADFDAAYRPAALLTLAAMACDDIGSAIDGFNGKIDSPRYFSRPLATPEREMIHRAGDAAPKADLAWVIGEHFSSQDIREEAGRVPPGRIINGAERGVTGRNWTGESDSFHEVPEQYSAIYFHSDEMVDANWDYNLEFKLPEDSVSGVYNVVLSAGGFEDRYPLFVRGKPEAKADVLFLIPTNTYLAYGNDHFAGADLTSVLGHDMLVSEDERYLNQHPEFGLSCYDVHADGSPVRYSSRRRPLVNVRPHYPNFLTGTFRHLAVDLFFVEWLERTGHSYHVATDEDLHLSGSELLSKYKVVITGSHPEYWTSQALSTLDAYLREGGRMMYLGGNGFYWVTTHDPARPWIIEVRRDNAGLRAWNAPPGERTHAHTGEPGGLWRYRGRGPNKICGVAFAMEGWSKAQGYKRTSESYGAKAGYFFKGIGEDLIGNFGYILGGAAGDECDRFDLSLGSPPQTIILASATGFGVEYQIVNEDMLIPMPHQDGTTRPDRVRSDMVFVPIHGGGGVFSASSIAFVGAIAWNEFENNIAKLVNNVLDAFISRDSLLD